jgi:hypothetical protein
MKATDCAVLAVALICLIGISCPAKAAEPAADPVTLWNFLGIPQGIQKLQDSLINPKGNFPGLERKPALKSIADPANLEEGQPEVIKKAAQIKAAEDLAPQKIKAIKYLAKVGCGCYEEVDAALLDALGDCTEEVRLEAVKAFESAAGEPCDACGGAGCCNAKTMTKLYELAYGQDEKCCYKEPSEKVRKAARAALQACQKAVPPVPPSEPAPPPEFPEEAPGEVLEPELAPDDGQPMLLEEPGVEMRIRTSPSVSRVPTSPTALNGAQPGSGAASARMGIAGYNLGPPAPGFQRHSKSPRPAVTNVPQIAESDSWLDLRTILK